MPSRRGNSIILVGVLLLELLVLGWQVHRNHDISLVRQGAMLLVTPIEEGIRAVSDGTWGLWQNYVDLRGARRQNQQLSRELDTMKRDYQRLQDEAAQGKRLQVLLDFKQRVPSETTAAQVISSGGNDNSRLLVLDKGEQAGLRPDMAVIVPDGIVGKVLRVFPYASQVLLLTDSSSGVACLLENSRVHGILKGQNKPLAMLSYVVNDEKVLIGERVFTSGEDQIYPKGSPVGVVVEAHPGASFQEILVQPFAKLDRLEEVLAVTKKADVELSTTPAAGRTVANYGPALPDNLQRAAVAKPGPIVAAPGKPAPLKPVVEKPAAANPTPSPTNPAAVAPSTVATREQ